MISSLSIIELAQRIAGFHQNILIRKVIPHALLLFFDLFRFFKDLDYFYYDYNIHVYYYCDVSLSLFHFVANTVKHPTLFSLFWMLCEFIDSTDSIIYNTISVCDKCPIYFIFLVRYQYYDSEWLRVLM